jgi:hypothetical protein
MFKQVWDRRQRGTALTYDNKYQVLAVSFNASSEQVFFAGIDNDIKVWDTRQVFLLFKIELIGLIITYVFILK